MRTHQIPLFRKVISPWYDSETACIVVVVFTVLVLGFGLLGAAVALDHPAYQGDIWMPLLLVFMSFYVLVSTIVRLLRRRRGKYTKFD